MAFLQVNISGLAAAEAALSPERIEAALSAAMAEIGQRGVARWRTATPRRTGRLRRSEHAERYGPLHLQFRVTGRGFYYGPVNARHGMTDALSSYLGSNEVQSIFARHLAAALGG